MRTDKLVKLIKEAASDHFHNRYKQSMSLRGRYRAGRKLAEEDAAVEDSKKKKQSDNGVDSTPNKIEINPVLTHSIVQSR